MWGKAVRRLTATSDRSRDVLCALTLLALSTVFFANVLFTDLVLVSDNVDSYYPWVYYSGPSGKRASNGISDRVLEEYPQRLVAVRTLRSGDPPLWNPYCLSGMPLLATEPHRGFLYPFNGLFYLIDPLRALGYVSFSQLFLAALFMYFYLKSIALRAPAALFGAIVFGLGGFFLPYLSWLDRVSTGIWMPLMFLCIEKLIQDKTYVWAIALAFAIGMAGLAGHFGVVAYQLLAVGVYSVWGLTSLLRNKGAAKAAQRGFLLVAGLIVGLLIAAVQLIPTYEALQFVERANRPYEARLEGGRPLHVLAMAIIPDIFGNPVDQPGWGRHAFGTNVPGYYAPSSTYCGVLPLVLAVSALAFKRSRNTLLFAMLATLSIAIFLDTVAFRVLYYVSIFRFGRQEEAKIIYFFAISVLAALGLDSLVRLPDDSQRKLARMMGAGLCLSGLLVMIAALLVRAAIHVGRGGGALGFAQQWYSYSVNSVIRFLVLTFACSLLFFLLSQRRIKAHVFSTLVIILAVADLFYFGWRFNPVQSSVNLYPETSSIRFLQGDRSVYRVMRGPLSRKVFPPDVLQVYGISDAQGYTPLLLDYYVEFMDLIEDNISGTRTIYSLRDPISLSSKLLDLLNVKYVITIADPGQEMEQLEQTDDNIELAYDGEVNIYENKDVLPRAFVVTEYEVLQDKQQIFATLTSAEFDPAEQVILEQEPEPLSGGTTASAEVSSAEIVEYTPNKVIVEVRMSGDGFLVLSDLYYSGWRAFVDGEQETIYKADYIFRAVQLGQGRHIVEFVFDPLSFKVGLVISVSTLLVVGAFLACALLGRKRAQSSAPSP